VKPYFCASVAGELAQLARALAWHARGHRFDSGILHALKPFRMHSEWLFFYVSRIIIYSKKLDRFYIGHTEDLQKRLLQHNNGISTFTSKATDWVLKYSSAFNLRTEAMKIENEIKRKKSRKYIEWLISQ
jgi:putative endonuclease